jgi:adenylate cyclase
MSKFLEIERRFLVRSRNWPTPERIQTIRQAYLSEEAKLNVRIRQYDETYVLSLKSTIRAGVRREFEIAVPTETGAAMFDHLADRTPIEKQRHVVVLGQERWEIDVFEGDNAGLIIAEIELADISTPITLPSWLGPEITNDARFTNNALYRHPFRLWGVTYEDLLTAP